MSFNLFINSLPPPRFVPKVFFGGTSWCCVFSDTQIRYLWIREQHRALSSVLSVQRVAAHPTEAHVLLWIAVITTCIVFPGGFPCPNTGTLQHRRDIVLWRRSEPHTALLTYWQVDNATARVTSDIHHCHGADTHRLTDLQLPVSTIKHFMGFS